MARRLRMEYAGARYHVMARGNARQAHFHDEDDYQRMLTGLKKTMQRTGHLFQGRSRGELIEDDSYFWGVS